MTARGAGASRGVAGRRSPTPRKDRAQGGDPARTGPRRAHAMPTRRCALPASRRLDRGDVDLAHLHPGVEGAFGRGSVGAGDGLGQGAGRDLPRQAPLVLAPAAGTLLAAVVDDRVPTAIGLGLVVGGVLARERLAVLELRASVLPDSGVAPPRELDGQS